MKTQFAKGLFIRNDDDGKPCHVGDIVKVKVGEGKVNYENYLGEEKIMYLEEQEYEGVLILSKRKGIQVRLEDGSYIKPNLTNQGYRKWSWKIIKSEK